MITQQISRADAEKKGYLGYNNGIHLCVDLQNESCETITVKLPNGRRVAFAFVQGENGYACCDISDDTLGDTDKQQVCVMGRGPTFYGSGKDAVTVTSVSLRAKV